MKLVARAGKSPELQPLEERKIPHRVEPIDPEEACRAYEAMRAEVEEECRNAPPNESMTVFEAMQRYQRMLKNRARR